MQFKFSKSLFLVLLLLFFWFFFLKSYFFQSILKGKWEREIWGRGQRE